MRGTTEKRWLRAEEGAYGDEPWRVPGPFLRREPPKCREFTIPVKNVTDRNSPPSKFKFKVDAKGLYSAQSFKQQFCNTLHPRNNRERSSRLCGKTSKSNTPMSHSEFIGLSSAILIVFEKSSEIR